MSMTDIITFVKRQRRIPPSDTEYDQLITDDATSAYQQYCRRLQQIPGHPGLRNTATFAVVGGTQDYNLATNFDRLIDDSVRYYNPDEDNPIPVILTIVNGPDAEIWESMGETYSPAACRVIPGATGDTRKLRLLPDFTQDGYEIAYAYWKRPVIAAVGDALEIPELEDAIKWNAVSNSYDYFRDERSGNSQNRADLRAREAFKQVLGLYLS